MEIIFGALRAVVGLIGRLLGALRTIGRALARALEYLPGKRRLRALLFLGLGGGALLTIVAALLAYGLPLLSRFWADETQAGFEDAHRRAMAIALFDANGVYLGALDRGFEADVFSARRPVEIDGVAHYPDHKTHHLPDAPPAYWACVSYLEDRRLGGPWNPQGVDFIGILRAPVASLQASFAAGALKIGGGGSTLPMQLARSFFKLYPGDPQVNALERKWLEWRSAPPLYRMLTSGADADPDRRLRQWTALHFAHIQGAGPGDVFGVEATARVLFGKGAFELTAAEQYLLAGSIRQPIAYGSRRIWRQAAERAELCVVELMPADAQAAALAELAALAERPPAPFLDPRLERAFAATGTPHARAGSPESLASVTLGGAQRGVAAELRDAFGALVREQVAVARLTLDATENMVFVAEMDALLAELPERWGQRFDSARFALTRAGLIRASGGPPRLQLPIVVAAADAEGRIVLYYSSGFDSFYHGLTAQRRRSPIGLGWEAYAPALERREIASVGKILGALALADAGETDPNERWSNYCLRPRASWCYCGEPPCLDGWPTVPAREALGRSLNDAMIRRLARRTVSERLTALARRAGLTRPPAHRDSPPETMTALGWWTAAPRRAQMLAAAALDYALGGSGQARQPRLIQTVERLSLETDARRPSPFLDPLGAFDPARGDIDLQLRGGAAGRRFVAAVLSAPIEHERGTLRGLRAWRAGRNGVALHLAKTGTSGVDPNVVSGYDNYDWWIVGAISFEDGRRYSYVVAVGYGSPAAPFARDLGGGAAAPIADLALRRLAAMGAREAP